MKRRVIISLFGFILCSSLLVFSFPATAQQQTTYTLQMYALMFLYASDAFHFVELVITSSHDVALNYFDSLMHKNLAYYNGDDLTVIVVDRERVGENTFICKVSNPAGGPELEHPAWTPEVFLKKVAQKKMKKSKGSFQ